MTAIFEWLLDRSIGAPGPEGHWPTWLSVAFHAANLLIACGLVAIPTAVAMRWTYRRDGVSPLTFWSVLSFLPVMAVGRFLRFVAVWGPPYRLTAFLDVATAALTLYAAFRLPALLTGILRLPSREELHAAKNLLQAEVLEKEITRLEAEDKYRAVARELEHARQAIKDQVWIHDTRRALDRLDAATRLLKGE